MLLHDPTGKMGTCKPLPDQVSAVAEGKDEMWQHLKLDNKETKLLFIYYRDNYMHMPLLLLEILIVSRLC